MSNGRIYPELRGFMSGFCKWACVILLVAMLVIIASQVALRNLFHIPMPWAQELSLYLMIYLALFGSVFVLHEKGHLRVDSLVERLPPGLQRMIHILLLVVQIVFFVTIIWFSVASLSFASKVQAVSLGVSMLTPYLALPVAFGLMLLETLFQTLDSLRGNEEAGT